MYDGPVIDAHHHLWDYSMGKHPWLKPTDDSVQALGNLEIIQRDYLPGDYSGDLSPFKVIGSVHIEALWDANNPVEETEWLETLEKTRGVAVRYVAAAPLGTDGAIDVIRRQSLFARVVGIRGILSHHPTTPGKSFTPDGRLAYNADWRRDVAELANCGLHLELMMYPYQAQAVADLASAFPSLQMVINHCASPVDQNDEGLEMWRSALRLLSELDNIALKISDIPAYIPDCTYEAVDEVVNECIGAFGVERCIFGTDYPVVGLNMGLEDVFDSFKQAINHLRPADQRAIMHDNAFKTYRFD